MDPGTNRKKSESVNDRLLDHLRGCPSERKKKDYENPRFAPPRLRSPLKNEGRNHHLKMKTEPLGVSGKPERCDTNPKPQNTNLAAQRTRTMAPRTSLAPPRTCPKGREAGEKGGGRKNRQIKGSRKEAKNDVKSNGNVIPKISSFRTSRFASTIGRLVSYLVAVSAANAAAAGGRPGPALALASAAAAAAAATTARPLRLLNGELVLAQQGLNRKKNGSTRTTVSRT